MGLAGPLRAEVPLEARVAEFARAALAEQAARAGWLAPEIQLHAAQARDRAGAQPCPGGWQLQALDLRAANRLRIAARCPGQAAKEFLLRAQLSAEVLVAGRAVPAGQALTAADLARERRDLTAQPDAIGLDTQAIGQAARSSLRAGQVLRQRLLVPALVVQRGEQVAIVASHDGIQVQAGGEALEAGAVGAVIKVRNSASGRVITARVLEAGRVEPVR